MVATDFAIGQIASGSLIGDQQSNRLLAGQLWSLSVANDNLAAAATIELRLTPATQPVMLRFVSRLMRPCEVLTNLANGLSGKVQLYEGTTFSAQGTPGTMINLDRRVVGGAAPIEIATGPTVSADGTLLGGWDVLTSSPQVILAAATNYMIRVTNGSIKAVQAVLNFQAFSLEVPNIGALVE